MAGTAVIVTPEFYGVNQSGQQTLAEVEALRLSHNAAVVDLAAGGSQALSVNTTAVGNVGAGEDDLMTYALAASKVVNTGAGIRVRAWGTSANNANAKTLKAYFGSAAVISQSLTASIAGRWYAEYTAIRTGLSAQDVAGRVSEGLVTLGTGKFSQEIGTATQTETGALTIKLTGTATTDNDIVQEGMTVEFLPVAADLTAFAVNLRY